MHLNKRIGFKLIYNSRYTNPHLNKFAVMTHLTEMNPETYLELRSSSRRYFNSIRKTV